MNLWELIELSMKKEDKIEIRWVQVEKLRKLKVRMHHCAKDLGFKDKVIIGDDEEVTSYMNDVRKVEAASDRLRLKKRGHNYTEEFEHGLLSNEMKKEFNELWKRYKHSPTLY